MYDLGFEFKFCKSLLGPKVHGCRPALVTFESFKDREDVLKNSKALYRSHVTLSIDLSKRTRESDRNSGSS